MKPRVRKVFKMVATAVVLLILTGGLLSLSVGSRLLQPAHKVVGPLPEDLQADAIQLSSGSGQQLAGWHFSVPQSKGVVVLLHGIRGSRLAMLQRARFLVAAGYSVVTIDLQSHGESTGDRITLGHLEQQDAKAAVQFAVEQHSAKPVFVIGVSLGGASALLASPLNVDGLIVEGVFSAIDQAVTNRVAERLGPLAGLPASILLMQLKPRLGISADQLRPIDRISQCDCPVFVISGADDPYTTAEEAEQMFEAAQEPKRLWLIKGATHTDLHTFAAEEYEERVLQFFAGCVSG